MHGVVPGRPENIGQMAYIPWLQRGDFGLPAGSIPAECQEAVLRRAAACGLNSARLWTSIF